MPHSKPKQVPRPNLPKNLPKIYLAFSLVWLAFATGCRSVAPAPLSKQEIFESSRQVAKEAFAGVPPVSRALSLEEAMARALKYNLHERTRQLEQAIALNLWAAGNYDMLPRVLASAGYRSRDSDLITRSRDSITGLPSLANPFISSDRDYTLSDLGVSWSVIDFTVGYFNAKQNANRVLIATEHRRKAMHTLCRDVAIAFWRMASAQKLMGELKSTVSIAEAALADAAKATTEGLRSPIESLRYQRQLMENIRLLSTIEKEFSTSRVTLANLISLPLGAEFTIAEPTEQPSITILEVPAATMEELAVLQNADLREQIYNQRIARDEVRKSLARLLPNLSLNYDLKHNTDGFLINNTWREAALLLSQNLTNLLAAPAQKRAADGGVALAAQRRMALQMALLAQVHIARLELNSAYRQLTLADRIWSLDQAIKQNTSNRADAQADSKLTKVAADTASIVSMLRRYQALAEFHAAASTLQATLGLEIDLGSVDQQSVDELARSLETWQRAWQTGNWQAIEGPAAPRGNPGPTPSPQRS